MFNFGPVLDRAVGILVKVPITKWLVVITLLSLVILLITIIRLT